MRLFYVNMGLIYDNTQHTLSCINSVNLTLKIISGYKCLRFERNMLKIYKNIINRFNSMLNMKIISLARQENIKYPTSLVKSIPYSTSKTLNILYIS